MIDLPALRGDDPLGFLAAVGLLALSEQGEIPEVSVSWKGFAAPIASVRGDIDGIDELAQHLQNAFQRLREAKAVIPDVEPRFPYSRPGSTTDPMRMGREEMSQLFLTAEQAWSSNPWLGRWLLALCAQTSVKDQKRGDVELTPFYAPTGRMTMRGSIFEKTMAAVVAADGPTDALTSWRRISYDGANFDTRSKRDAAFTTSGEAHNQGAPSPTWLAAMGLRFFPIVDSGNATSTVGWVRVRLYEGYTNRSLIWPTWRPFLDPAASRTLIAHPAVRPSGSSSSEFRFKKSEFEALGVSAIFGSSRRTLTQGDGPLGPAVRLWP